MYGAAMWLKPPTRFNHMCDLPALECAFIQQMLVTLVVFGDVMNA